MPSVWFPGKRSLFVHSFFFSLSSSLDSFFFFCHFFLEQMAYSHMNGAQLTVIQKRFDSVFFFVFSLRRAASSLKCLIAYLFFRSSLCLSLPWHFLLCFDNTISLYLPLLTAQTMIVTDFPCVLAIMWNWGFSFSVMSSLSLSISSLLPPLFPSAAVLHPPHYNRRCHQWHGRDTSRHCTGI